MESGLNPFSPNAGSRPPELVGRDDVLGDVQTMVERLPRRLSVQSMLLTGIRGVGKTVLLNEIARRCESGVVFPIYLEATDDRTLAEMLAAPLRMTLLKLDRMAKTKEVVRKGMCGLRNFLGKLKVSYGDFGIELEPMLGLSDSGDLQADLIDLFVAVADAAADNGNGVLLLIDEVQYLSEKELGALVMAMHRLQQLSLPMAMIGAGLPTLPGLTGNAKSYAERLFVFSEIGALSRENSIRAIRVPLSSANVRIEDEAVDFVFERSGGYPYFIQEWGFQLWNFVREEPITLNDARCVDLSVTEKLDRSFFRVRMERLTNAEKTLLFALIEMPGSVYKLTDVAEKMSVNVRALSPRRSSLIEKGMIYSPRTGEIAFTVPLFAEYLLRQRRAGRI